MVTVTRARQTSRGTSLGDLSDEALLLGYAETLDVDLFEELVKRYEGALREYLTRYSGDPELADDALQGTWLQLHVKCQTFQEGRRLRPWLFTIAVNQAIDAMRTRRRHRMLSIDQDCGSWASPCAPLSDCLRSSEGTSEDAFQRQEVILGVRRAISRLPVQQRELVKLVFLEGFKYHEAAAELAIPEGTAKSRMHAAFSRLQPHLDYMTH